MENNTAFIDAQNLYMSTRLAANPWKVDLFRLKKYLWKKYAVERAYYFIGYYDPALSPLYNDIEKSGFTMIFKPHPVHSRGGKKGNVDTDIVFHIMRQLYKQELLGKVVLVSGDGDYKVLVDFLIAENRFFKILFPNEQFASSLYKKIKGRFFDWLDKPEVRSKIQKQKMKRGP